MMVNLARGWSPAGQNASPIADIGRAQLEPLAGVDLDRIEKPAADELGAGDQRVRRADVLLQQMQPVDRRLVIGAGDIGGKRLGLEKTDAQPLAAAITLMQVSSRLLLVWGIVNNFPFVASSAGYSSMLFAWGVTEVVRYGFFVFTLSGYSPGIL